MIPHREAVRGRGCRRAAPRGRVAVVILAGLFNSSCGPEETPRGPAVTGAFADLFRLDTSIQLEEDLADPIGDIAILAECRNGDLLVGDRIKFQIRRYAPDGRLLAIAGRYGAGPLEFRHVGGLVEIPSGRILVTDPRLGRATILTPDLRADTVLRLRPAPRGSALAMGEALLLTTVAGPRATALTLFTPSWEPAWSIPAPSPGTMREFPYWDSYASVLADATPDVALTAYSLRYPIYVHGRSGRLVDSIASAPASFRPAPVVSLGAFAGLDAHQRQDEWLASFDVMSRLAIVNDSLLIVVHAVLRRTATSSAVAEDRRLDVYHLASRTRLAEDVALAPDERILAGGRGLYLLAAQPPEPWIMQRLTYVGPSGRLGGRWGPAP